MTVNSSSDDNAFTNPFHVIKMSLNQPRYVGTWNEIKNKFRYERNDLHFPQSCRIHVIVALW